jgi:hypothetical protein
MSFFRLKSVVCRVGSAGLVALPMFLGFARTAAAAPRIVCIGEQTTMTTEMSPTWPAQMQIDLGAAYSVTDDGDGGGTVLDGSKGGTHTFTTPTNAPFKDSIMAPDIVVIGPWAEHDEIAVQAGADPTKFQADYDALVMAYLGLPKKPCVIVTTPVVNTSYQQNPATDQLVMNTIEPAVLAVAKARSLPVVDLYTTFMGQAAWLGGDGHFSTAGAAEVAKLVEAALPSCSAGNGAGSGGAGGGGAAGAAAGGASSAAGNGSGGSAGAATGTAGASAAAAGATSSTGGASTASAGASSTTSAGTGGASDTPTESAPASESSGCAVSARSATRSRASWLVLFAGALLLLRRRRSRPAA